MLETQSIEFNNSTLEFTYCDDSKLYCLLKRNIKSNNGGKILLFSANFSTLSRTQLGDDESISSLDYLKAFKRRYNSKY
jgi:hypothetical protein